MPTISLKKSIKNLFITLLLMVIFLLWPGLASGELAETNGQTQPKGVPILLYHRFGLEVADSMTVTATYFESQLKHLRDQGHTVIPLRQLVDHFLGKRSSIPVKALVLTADDGHKSVYTEMLPLLKKYNAPATLFLYPSAISNAPYAMTREQIREIKATGLVDLQSHTFWHPNFKREKRSLNPQEYENLVEWQLRKGKERLEKEFNVKVDMLAWPFGIYDEGLMKKASALGYRAAFTMERRDASPGDNLMALPRYLVVDTTPKGGRGINDQRKILSGNLKRKKGAAVEALQD